MARGPAAPSAPNHSVLARSALRFFRARSSVAGPLTCRAYHLGGGVCYGRPRPRARWLQHRPLLWHQRSARRPLRPGCRRRSSGCRAGTPRTWRRAVTFGWAVPGSSIARGTRSGSSPMCTSSASRGGSSGRLPVGPRTGRLHRGTCWASSALWTLGGAVRPWARPGPARPAVSGVLRLAGGGCGAFRLREAGLRPLSVHPLGSVGVAFRSQAVRGLGWPLAWACMLVSDARPDGGLGARRGGGGGAGLAAASSLLPTFPLLCVVHGPGLVRVVGLVAGRSRGVWPVNLAHLNGCG